MKKILFLSLCVISTTLYAQSEIIFERSDGAEIIIRGDESFIQTGPAQSDIFRIPETENYDYSQDSKYNNYPDESDLLFVQQRDPESFTKNWMYLVQNNKDKDYAEIERRLKAGQKVDAPVIENNSMLILGAMQGNMELVNLALKYKANINNTNKDGETALHWATRNMDVTYRLLQANLNTKKPTDFINKQSKTKRTALHFAAFNRENNQVVDLLLNNGADINSVDNNNQTPAHMAAALGNWDTLEALLKRGANITLKDKDNISIEQSILDRADINAMLKLFPYLSVEGKATIKQRLQGYKTEPGTPNPLEEIN